MKRGLIICAMLKYMIFMKLLILSLLIENAWLNVEQDNVSTFLTEWENEASEKCFQVTTAVWNYLTNLTEHNKDKMVEIQLLNSKFERSSWKKAMSFRWFKNLDPLMERKLKLISTKRHYALSDSHYAELQQLIADMKDIYTKARICPFKSTFVTTCELALEPDASRVLAHSRDYEEQFYIWRSWRDSIGPFIKPRFVRYVELINEASKKNGFSDAGYEERSVYEMADLESEIASLWSQVLPLYKQLYTYVRRHLVQHYGAHRIKPDGPIPAHVLGNMWAQSWKNIIDLVLPFKGKRRIDCTAEMLRQGYTAHKMFLVAEEFFTSIGLKAMPSEFWQDSMISRPKDRPVTCKSSAWDFCNGKDFRIKQCTEVSMDDLFTIHHEMAHIQYYLHYAELPLMFRDGPNPGFHEAIGDMVLLSTMNPKYLQNIGLINNITDDYETHIDFLMEIALDKIVFLPFAYLVDLWRWSIFREGTSNMNQRWWELRLRYQGIIPPISRNNNDFDPAAKYHIISDIPYIKYFISVVIQFQLYESICIAAGHIGPLHTCNIYRSQEAGKLLKDIMSVGASKSWQEVLKIATRGKSNSLDVRPMLEYFKPLHKWLEIKNKNEPVIGWIKQRIESAQFGSLERNTAIKINLSYCLLILLSCNYVLTFSVKINE